MAIPLELEVESPSMPDFDSLHFIKLKFPRLIPTDLIECVKGRTFTPEQFFDYQENQVHNPHNLLYVLINQEKRIYGYLWCDINALDSSLFVNTFSVDKHFWHKGKIMPKVTSFLKEIKKQHTCKQVFWLTTNEKFFAKHGFKRSKHTLMEYKDGSV